MADKIKQTAGREQLASDRRVAEIPAEWRALVSEADYDILS